MKREPGKVPIDMDQVTKEGPREQFALADDTNTLSNDRNQLPNAPVIDLNLNKARKRTYFSKYACAP